MFDYKEYQKKGHREATEELKEGMQVVYDPKSSAEVRVKMKVRLVMRVKNLLPVYNRWDEL